MTNRLLKEQEKLELNRKMGQWIRIIDNVPENDGNYLVYCINGEVHEASYSALREAHWLDPVEEYEVFYVTHWMKMPEPPKE